MTNTKRNACSGKVRHPTLLAAQIALKRTVSRARKGDPIVTGMSAYRCSFCDGFHIGRSQRKGIDWGAVEARDKEVHRGP